MVSAKLEENIRDLLEAIQALRNDLKAASQESQPTKRWLRTNEVADYLNLSNSQIHVLKSDGVIPSTKVGGTIFFEIKDVDQVLKNNK